MSLSPSPKWGRLRLLGLALASGALFALYAGFEIGARNRLAEVSAGIEPLPGSVLIGQDLSERHVQREFSVSLPPDEVLRQYDAKLLGRGWTTNTSDRLVQGTFRIACYAGPRPGVELAVGVTNGAGLATSRYLLTVTRDNCAPAS